VEKECNWKEVSKVTLYGYRHVGRELNRSVPPE